jgi:polyisoprenoid-binding protein YceI
VLGRDGKNLQLQSVNVVLDTTTLKSDESKRDNQMKSIGLETNKFPSATFVSTTVVSLDADAESGKPIKATVAGKLTLHGVTRDVQVAVDSQLRSGTMEIVGRVEIAMKDYGIDPPEIADFVKADDTGTLEFKLVLRKA